MRTVLALGLLLLSAAPAAAGASGDLDAWRAHHRRGVILSDLARYDEAISEFEQAYEIRNDPLNLFEIAEVQRTAGRYREAARFYNTYLLRAPHAGNRRKVAELLAEMERIAGEQEAAATTPPTVTDAGS